MEDELITNAKQIDVDRNEIFSILENGNDWDLINVDLWDVLPTLCKNLSRDASLQNEHLASQSENALKRIAAVANPKEFILILFAEFEDQFDVVKFCALLKPLCRALLQLPDKYGKSLSWCLGSIHDCIVKNLEPPELDGEDGLCADHNDEYSAICKVYEGLAEFYLSFLEEISSSLTEVSGSLEELRQLKNILGKHIIRMLGRPIINLDLETGPSEAVESRIKKLVNILLAIIFSISDDVISYLEDVDSPYHNFKSISYISSSSSNLLPALSAANFYYLIFCEKISPSNKIPRVYSHSYLRCNLFPLATALLSCQESPVRKKGLLLSNFMFLELDCNFTLEGNLVEPLMLGLVTCITYEGTEENRQLGFDVFRNYFGKLSIKETYLVLLRLRHVIKNSSLIAYLITFIKDMLIKNYQHPLFSHKYLFDLIILYCTLPDGTTTDLIQSAKEIIAALNFIRFLIIRDKQNELGTREYRDQIQDKILDPLKEALKLSRSHWEHKREIVNEGNCEDDKISVTVSGQNVPKMPRDDQNQMVNSAFNCMDLLESLLDRVNECVSESQLH